MAPEFKAAADNQFVFADLADRPAGWFVLTRMMIVLNILVATVIIWASLDDNPVLAANLSLTLFPLTILNVVRWALGD